MYALLPIVLARGASYGMSARWDVDFDVEVFVNADGVGIDVIDGIACPSDALLPCCSVSVASCSPYSSVSDPTPSRWEATAKRSSGSSGVDDRRSGDGFLGLPVSDGERETTGLRMGERDAAVGVSRDMADVLGFGHA